MGRGEWRCGKGFVGGIGSPGGLIGMEYGGGVGLTARSWSGESRKEDGRVGKGGWRRGMWGEGVRTGWGAVGMGLEGCGRLCVCGGNDRGCC